MHDDLRSLLPRVDLTRRGFVVTTLAAGFALSVQPVTAETIRTDTTGLEAGEVKIPVADGDIPAYRASRLAARTCRWYLSCKRFSVFTSMSRTFAGTGEARLSGDRSGALCPARRRLQDRRLQANRGHRGVESPRRAGNVGPRRDRGLGQGVGRCRHRQIGHYRLLLGRPDRLALCGPQPTTQSRRGLVRSACRERSA